MDIKEREQEQQKNHQELDEASARLQSLEAEAEQRNAEGAKAEISSLNALQDRIRDQVGKLRDADESTFGGMCEQIREDLAALRDRADTAAERLRGIAEMEPAEQLDAELVQLGSAVDTIIIRLEDEASGDQDFGEAVRDDLREAWQDVGDKRRQLESAGEDKKSEMRSNLQDALDGIKDRLHRIVTKLKARREAEAEPRV
jgi:hypothetical protein